MAEGTGSDIEDGTMQKFTISKKYKRGLPYFPHYKAHRIIRRTFNEWPILELFSYIGRTGLKGA